MSPLMGVVLSDVSAAGVGGGVFATTQQAALALGVATLGGLFLALAGDAAGIRNAFLVVVAVQAIAAVGAAGGRGDYPTGGRGRDGHMLYGRRSRATPDA